MFLASVKSEYWASFVSQQPMTYPFSSVSTLFDQSDLRLHAKRNHPNDWQGLHIDWNKEGVSLSSGFFLKCKGTNESKECQQLLIE